MVRWVNFTPEEFDCFLDAVEEVLPLLVIQWESIAAMHVARYPTTGRNMGSLKKKVQGTLHQKGVYWRPSLSAHCLYGKARQGTNHRVNRRD